LPTSSRSSVSQAPSPTTAAELLAQKWPALGKYYPHLQTVSAPQTAYLVLDCREAFYGGAAGGGKSDALLMAALQYVDRPGYNALLLRRTFPELEGADGLITKAHEWLGPFRATGELHWNEQKHRWTFPSGATIQFGHVQNETDVYRYQGQAYQFVGFDELTHFTETQYEYIAFTRSRRVQAHAEAGIPVRARSASNPGNIGHGWVKTRFITSRKPSVVFVPAKIDDNPGLDKLTYTADLAHLPEELRKQLLEGDWDAFEGAAYTVTDTHLVDEFPLADAHDRFEACDYGLNGAPWALIPVDYEGNLVFYDMLYERDLIPSQLAPLVVEKRKAGWGHGHQAYADPSIWHRTGGLNKWGAPAMLADEFRDNGVPVVAANNDPRAGLIRLRELLEPDPKHPFPNWHPRAGEMGAPRLFFVRSRMAALVEELQSAPLQPVGKPDGGEKVDPEWESRHGHAAAMARYAAMTRPRASVEPQPELEDSRAELLRRVRDQRVKPTPGPERFQHV
jgi:hypothetical protein